MQVPEEFEELCGYIGGFSHIEEYSPRQWIASAVKQFGYTYPDKQHASTLMKFLNELVDGKHDDAELQQVWNGTSAGFVFRDAVELRVFLTMIRDAMKKVD